MPARVILNPYAGRWQALHRRQEACDALEAAGIEYELVLTTRPGHGVQLAEAAVRQGYTPIIAAGGDGSISEVVNGMLQALPPQENCGTVLPPLGILPLGSANDLIKNLGLPLDLPAAAGVIATGQVRCMDLGQVNGRYFDNNAAIGLEPCITLIQQSMRYIYGDLRYLLATLRGVWANPQWQMELEWEGGSYTGPVTLVTVGNNRRTGGLFYVTPHADPFDGRLTFVYGYLPTRLEILRVLPQAMKPDQGNYVEHPAIHEVHSPWLKVRCHPTTPLHADGEIQSTAASEIEYRIVPASLPVLMKAQVPGA